MVRNDDPYDDNNPFDNLAKDFQSGMTAVLSTIFNHSVAVVDPSTKIRDIGGFDLAPVPLRLSLTGVIRGLISIREQSKQVTIYDNELPIPQKKANGDILDKVQDDLHSALNNVLLFSE
jgi:hypothetical protein